MALAAFNDNFADLTGWTNSGLTAASNKASATVAGTLGAAYKAHAAVANTEWSMSVDFVIDKTDTAGRFTWIGMTGSSGSIGLGVAYIAGTGICPCYLGNDAMDATPNIAVPDSLLVTGERYHIELSYQWAGSYFSATAGGIIIQVTDEQGNFLGAGYALGSVEYHYDHQDRLYIKSTSAVNYVARLNWQPSYFSTSEYAIEPKLIRREAGVVGTGDAANVTSALIPKITAGGDVSIFCHGAGAFYVDNATFSDRVQVEAVTNFNRRGVDVAMQPWARLFIRFGNLYPTIAPVNGTTNLWGNADSVADLDGWYDWLVTQVGGTPNIHLFGYSMGGLQALRFTLFGTNKAKVKSLTLMNPVCGLYQAWLDNETWAGQIETAYEESLTWDTDTEAAHTAFDALDPLYAGVSVANFPPTVIYNRTTDVNVNPVNHANVLALKLAAAGVPMKHVTSALTATNKWVAHCLPLSNSEVEQIMDARADVYHRPMGSTSHIVM